ncbi:MAG: hypothetical protein KBF35_08845 [Saprospiraceae bacterium]|nr:hypothetical protein [Saprospiraceae bacterium]
MNRKEAIKGLVAIGIIATIPSLVKLTNKGKSIHFIGLGGAGSKALGHIYKQGMPASYTYITDVEHFKSNSKIKFISYTHSEGKSSQIGKNPYTEAEMLEKLVLPFELNELFNENDTYILLAGLGGFTGTKVSESLIYWLRENKRDFHAILSLPFKFESRRRNYAQKMIEKYQKFPNVYFFDNEEIKEICGNKHIAETLVSSDNEFYKVVKEKAIV